MNKEIQNFLTDHLGAAEWEMIPIKKGGSDRSFFAFTCLISPVLFYALWRRYCGKLLLGGHHMFLPASMS